eukprot:12395539-Heterocapsa_arctica.AAC.1
MVVHQRRPRPRRKGLRHVVQGLPTTVEIPPQGGPPSPGPRRNGEDDDDNHRKKMTGTIDLGKLPNHGGFHLWRSG